MASTGCCICSACSRETGKTEDMVGLTGYWCGGGNICGSTAMALELCKQCWPRVVQAVTAVTGSGSGAALAHHSRA